MYIFRMGTEDMNTSRFPEGKYAELLRDALNKDNFQFQQLIVKEDKVVHEDIKGLPLLNSSGGMNDTGTVMTHIDEKDYLILNPRDVMPSRADRMFVIYTMKANDITIQEKKGVFKTEEEKTRAKQRKSFYNQQVSLCKQLMNLMKVPWKETLPPAQEKRNANDVREVSMWDEATKSPSRWRLSMTYKKVQASFKNDEVLKKLPRMKTIKAPTQGNNLGLQFAFGGQVDSDVELDGITDESDDEFNEEFDAKKNLYM
jgi:hypothetical protein